MKGVDVRHVMRLAAVSLVALAFPHLARAQWMTQRIALSAGWNAVHLKVYPADARCEVVFSDARIEEVTWWNRDRLDDGTGAAVADTCNWYRGSTGEANTFSRVIGDQRYLVKASGAVTLDVVGTPALPKGTIYLGEYNLVGVNAPNLAGANAPTYFEYFEPCPAGVVSWYGVTSAGDRLRLANSAKASDASKALWLETSGSGTASYSGPFSVGIGGSAKTLEWTADATAVRTLTVKNVSSKDRVLRIERSSSLPPPTGRGTCAGDVSLLRETVEWSDGYAKRVFVPMTFPFATNLAAGATLELRVRPDADHMPASSGDYMSILVVSDKGSTLDGELRPDGTCLCRVGAFASGSLAANTRASAAGLWVGTVVLGQVNRAKMLGSSTPEWDPEALLAAPHAFQFRLILHVDDNGTAKILKQVFTAKRSADADHSDLLTDRDTAILYREMFPGATIRRTASANFPFADPIALSGGEFMSPGSELSATFTQAYDDKTNPFVHSFHPQHDNVEFRNGTPHVKGSGDEGVGDYESWGVTREVTLEFLDEDPSRAAGQNWNRTVTGGVYTERVTGLVGQGKPIITRGIFRLSKVCDTPQLTTEVIH